MKLRIVGLFLGIALTSLPAAAAYHYRLAVSGLKDAVTACALPWGGSLAVSQSIVGYSRDAVPEGETCSPYASTVLCDSQGKLTLNGATTDQCSPTDPHWSAVTALFHGDSNLQDSAGGSYGAGAEPVSVVAAPAKVGAGSIALLANARLFSSQGQLAFGTGDFTVEFWYYMQSAAGAYQYLLDNKTLNGQRMSIRFGDGGYGHRFQVIVGSDPGNMVTLAQDKNAFIGKWRHIAVSRQGTSVRVYLDGVRQATMTSAASIGGTSFLIGNDSTAPMLGYVDELRVTKGVARYTGDSFTPNTVPFPDR